jgi:hypothetical protein
MSYRRFLTYDDAVELARAAVVERGSEFVYPDTWRRIPGNRASRCLYVLPNSDECACIIGVMLKRHGVSPRLLKDYEGFTVLMVFSLLKIRIDGKTVEFLAELQYGQDQGLSWGDALDSALNLVKTKELR